MRHLFVFICLTAVAAITYAQASAEKAPYHYAVGLRVSPIGYSYDLAMLSFKMFFSRRGALELNAGAGKEFHRTDFSYQPDGRIIGVDSHPLIASLSYQLHIPMFSGMRFIIGGAGMVQRRRDYGPRPTGDQPHQQLKVDSFSNYTGLGIGPVGGFDYTFKKLPLNITLDHRPAFLSVNRENRGEVVLLNIALAARFTF